MIDFYNEKVLLFFFDLLGAIYRFSVIFCMCTYSKIYLKFFEAFETYSKISKNVYKYVYKPVYK